MNRSFFGLVCRGHSWSSELCPLKGPVRTPTMIRFCPFNASYVRRQNLVMLSFFWLLNLSSLKDTETRGKIKPRNTDNGSNHQICLTKIVYFQSSHRAQTAETSICAEKRWVFCRFVEERPKARKCALLFCALFGALSGIGGYPTSCADLMFSLLGLCGSTGNTPYIRAELRIWTEQDVNTGWYEWQVWWSHQHPRYQCRVQNIPVDDLSEDATFKKKQPFSGIIKRGVPQAYVRARVKRNAVFGARFKGLALYFLYIKMESDTYQNGLGYMSDTHPNPYPPVTAPPLWSF